MSRDDLTQMLHRAGQGDRAAQEELFRLVERQLRQLADSQMRKERPGHTLQTTILVDEAFVKLAANGADIDWQDRTHFYRAAARAMRRILVDHERIRSAQKRGGGRPDLPLTQNSPISIAPRATELLDLDEALDRLQDIAPRQSDVVQLHQFAGYTLPECAKLLGVSLGTVKAEWAAARAWLHRELTRD